MRYSSYKLKYASKIKKLNLLYKFRFVLAGAGALIIATTTTLLGVKGKVGETALDKATYTYGETINVTSSALMAKYSVEYSIKSKDEWTTSQPTRPGEYKARAVSKSGFGKTKYGKEQYFTIVPADLRLNIQSSSIIYGEDPALDLSEAKAKQVSVNEVSFTYGQKFDEVNPFGADKTFSEDVAVAKEKVRIADKSGVDVTDCFNVISESKTVSVSKRKVVIDVKDKIKAYDGTGLEADDYEVNSAYTLASGDNIHTSNATSIGAAIGSGEARMDFAIYHGDKDKTAFYDIIVNYGQLEIHQRELLIKTNSINRLYNGEVLSSEAEKNENKLSYTVEGDGLLPNHHINAVFDAENVYITNSGAINNSLSSYQILDEGNNPVDPSIYHVEVSTGHISIGKITLEINFDKKEKYYDGEGLEGTYTINGQKASTDRIEVSGLSKDNSIGFTEYGNIVIYNDELFSSPRDVTVECYNVLVNRSELTIKKRVITVKTNAIERTVYNGHALSSSPTAPSDSKLSYTVEGELFPGHHIRINSYALEERYTVSGEPNSVSFDIVDANNNVKTGESYYVVNTVFPTVNIGKQNLNLVFDTSAKTYNGSDFEIPFSVGSGGLASTDEIKITPNSNIVDKNPGTHIFAPEVEIYRKNTEIKMTDYYSITYSGGSSVKVNKVDLTISTNAVNETYDGVAFSSNPSARSDRKLSYTVQGLLPGHHLADVVFTHEGAFRPIYDINEISYDIEDENGDSVKDVYNIHEYFKVFNIYRRDISVSFNNVEKPYDGSVLTPSPSINGVLASGDQLQSISTYDSDVGIYPYSSNSLRITNPSNGDVTNCYNISYADYEFVIRQRNIFVKSQDINKTYDSNPLTVGNQSDNLRIQEYGNSEHLLDNLNHHFVVYYYRQGLIDCVSDISNDFIVSVEDSLGNNVNQYYNLNQTSGKININKRDITITFNDKNTDVFDGEYHGYDNTELTVSGLATNDTLICSHRDAGSYFGTDLFDITRSATSVKSNYNMHLDSSKKFTINKLKIDYYLSTTNSGHLITKTYNGHPIQMSDSYAHLTPHIEYKNGLLPSGYTANIELTNSNLTDVNGSEAELKYKLVIKDSGGYPVSNYELNNFELKDVKVNPVIKYRILPAFLSIAGTPFNESKTYDGTPLKKVADVATISGLADTDQVLSNEFEYTSETYFTNGAVNIDFETFIVRNISSGKDVTNNYILPTNLGTYDVSKRNITIVLDNLNKVYDAESFRKGDITYTLSGNTLAAGDKLSYDIDGTYKNVTGGTLFGIKDVKITRGNVDVTNSYNITVQKGQCEITQRPISFKALDYSKVYDGSSINESNYHLGYVYTGALCGGHDVQFTFNTISNTKDVGVHENKIISATIKEGQTDVTGNYYVTTYDGTVSIEQRVIKYRIYDTAFVYDGKDRNVDKVVTFDELGNTNVVRITNNFGDDPNVTEFLSNSTFSAEFTYDGAPNDVKGEDEGDYYSFFYDGTYATHSFSGVIYITVDGTTYTSTSGVTTGNVKFEKDISSEDNLLTYTANKRNIVISNAEMKRVFLYTHETNNLEQIYCSNLASGDVLWLRTSGDEYEQYSSSKKEYALIEVNGEILPVGTDYVRGANFINYLNATAVANKDIKIMHGDKDVTNAYNISFNFQDTILFDVIAV